MSRLRFIFLSSILICLLLPSYSQTPNPFYEEVVTQVSYDTILANLQKFESLGIKEPGTVALENTANWLIEKYQSYGYTNIVRDTFNYNGKQFCNIIVSRQGSSFPPRYLIIDGHYDTYQGPGVNDNGSGVASILEVARLMSNIPTKLSLKFINFSAEEEGLIGSQHYVDHTVVPVNMNILLVLNIDEVGGVAGMINNTITCERDEASPTSNNAASYAFTDTLVNLTHLYSNLLTQISYAYGSDYVPFQEAGKVITGFYETNESPYVHSTNDMLNRMSPTYVTQVAKAATGAALHFAQAYLLNTGTDKENGMTNSIVYPNPAGGILRWQLPITEGPYIVSFYNAIGKLLARKQYNQGDLCQADISCFNDGMIVIRFEISQGQSFFTTRILKTHCPDTL